MREPKDKSLTRIKTGSFERRLSLTRMSLLAGSRFVAHSASNLFASKEQRELGRRRILSEQSRRLVEDLGKLKGSIVKIGQMMALYGEHFLPEEVTSALHTLEDRTVAVAWPVMREILLHELGPQRLAELDIDPVPLAAASLGQVHLARRRRDGHSLCLKIQYPGVAKAIDSDIDVVAQLINLGTLGRGSDFAEWLDEVRNMLHREVDYRLEAQTTEEFRRRLHRDKRFVVPEVDTRYSTKKVLATSFEQGYAVTSGDVEALPQERRNQLGRAFLELFLREIFEWRELQSDPNFGNYRVRPASDARGKDRIVLLDFGAVQKFPDSFIAPLQQMIRGAYRDDYPGMVRAALDLRFIQPDFPEPAQRSFVELCAGVIEPLVFRPENVPGAAVNAQGHYRWKHSDLPMRTAKRASKSAFSSHFKMPPHEFVFLNRKLIGVYTFIAMLDAEFNGADIIEKYL